MTTVYSVHYGGHGIVGSNKSIIKKYNQYKFKGRGKIRKVRMKHNKVYGGMSTKITKP